MASKWGEKLQSNFSPLTETSSKESIQAFAKWIYFNRKQKAAFVESFRSCVQKRQSLDDRSVYSILLSVLHEVFMLHHGTSDKWESAADLRLSLGESLVLDFALLFPPSKFQTYLQQWDTANVFGGPTLIHQIRKKLSSPSSVASTDLPPPDAGTITASPEEPHAVGLELLPEEPEVVAIEKSTSKSPQPQTEPIPISVDDRDDASSDDPIIIPKPIDALATLELNSKNMDLTSPPSKDLVYDFESKGIPAASVDPKEFIEPCRLIATLQIARDLRSDSAVQLSSMLQGLPESVRVFIAEAAEKDGQYELTDEKAREFCAIVNDQLLDFDMHEQLQNVITFLDIVRRQRIARQKILELIIASRCQFGANDAAAAYLAVDDTVLKQRAQILADAMDLEGLEVQPISVSAMAALEAELPPLSWYEAPTESTDGNKEDSHKRQKVDDT